MFRFWKGFLNKEKNFKVTFFSALINKSGRYILDFWEI